MADTNVQNTAPQGSAITRLLPPEVLTQIASFLPPLNHRRPKWERIGFVTERRLPDRLVLTQVCRQWRLTLHENKALWSDIPVYNTKFAIYALEHSDPAPITIDVQFGEEDLRFNCLSSVPLVFSHVPRARIISFIYEGDRSGNPPAYFKTILEGLVPKPAPLLESFRLDHEDHDYFSGRFLVPDNIFDGHVPRLRHLTLTFCDINPSISILQASLTKLSLGNCRCWLTIDEMLDALARLPGLRSLALKNVEREGWMNEAGEVVVTPGRGQTSLPALEDVSIQGSVRIAVAVSSHLAFPPTTWVNFGAYYVEPENISEIVAAVEERTATYPPASHLNIICTGRSHHSPFCTSITFDGMDGDGRVPIPLRLLLDRKWGTRGDTLVLTPSAPLYNVPLFSGVRSLDFVCGLPHNDYVNELHTALHALTSLELISVAHHGETLVATLYYNATDTPPQLFPSVSTIHFDSANISQKEESHSFLPQSSNLPAMRNEPKEEQVTLFSALLRWVELRKAAGLHVSLEFEGCGITAEDLDKLRAVLGDRLTWDGNTTGTGEVLITGTI